jgi:hypothetical protein
MNQKLLTLNDLPEGWTKGDYQKEAMVDNWDFFDYVDHASGMVRVAVFKDFRRLPENEGYGTYDFISGRDGNWEQLCAGLESREHAIHVLVTYVITGAYDANTG